MSMGVRILAAACVGFLFAVPAGAEKLLGVREKAVEDIGKGVPLSVDRCVQVALTENPSLRSSAARTLSTERAVLGSYATFLPRVGASYDASRSRVGFSQFRPAGEQEYDQHSIGISVSQTLFSYSGIKGIHAARNGRGADRASLEADRQSLAFEVRAACHDVLKTVDLLEVARENLGVGEEQLKLAEKRKEVGSGVTADVLKAKAQVESNHLDVITAEKNLAVARASLLAFLGLDVTLSIEIEKPTEEAAGVPTFDESMKEAEANRPDLREADYALRASKDAVGVAWGGYLPSLGASFFYGWDDSHFSPDILDKENSSWSARVALDVPIFDVGTVSEIRQKRALEQASEGGFLATRKAVELEVQEAILAIEESRKKIEVAARTVAAAEEDLRISKGKYEHGLVPILDLIQAQASLRQARAAGVEAIYDHLTARAAWEKAVGEVR